MRIFPLVISSTKRKKGNLFTKKSTKPVLNRQKKALNQPMMTFILKCFNGRFDPDGLDDGYGEDEVKLVVARFSDLLIANGCDSWKSNVNGMS